MGKRKLISLGVFQDVPLAVARERRDAARKLLAGGQDPSTQRQIEKRSAASNAANSFEAVAREWYGKQVHTWVPSHAADVLRRLETNLFPEIGATPIARVDRTQRCSRRCARSSIGARTTWRIGSCRSPDRCSATASRQAAASATCPIDLRGALTPHQGKHQAAIKPEELPALLRAIEGYAQLGDRLTAWRCGCSR